MFDKKLLKHFPPRSENFMRKLLLPSLPGPASESPRSSTIGSDEWLLNIIVLQSLFLVGPSTARVLVGVLRPQMNFLMPLLLGLVTQIHGSERHGRRAKG